MGTGIVICGLNGVGKSTLGKALAEALRFYFIDSEELYFPKESPCDTYSFPRTHEEAKELLLYKVKAHENFVFSAVKGNYGEKITSLYRYAVLIEVPKEIRMERVKNRSFETFGDRMLPGGDLYEQEKRFFHMAESRTEESVRKWAQSLGCPVIRADGAKEVEENVNAIIREIGVEK